MIFFYCFEIVIEINELKWSKQINKQTDKKMLFTFCRVLLKFSYFGHVFSRSLVLYDFPIFYALESIDPSIQSAVHHGTSMSVGIQKPISKERT